MGNIKSMAYVCFMIFVVYRAFIGEINMKTLFNNLPLAATVALGLMGIGSSAAYAGATIFSTSGSIALGVNDEGQLNTTSGSVAVNSGAGATGISYQFPDGTYRDATSPGCLCEGWGVSVNGTHSGFADVSGPLNLTVDSFTSGANSATSSVHLTNLPGIQVTQAYAPSTTVGNEQILFRDLVTITNNTQNDVSDLRYVRVMDWDVPPTEFNEYITIAGATAGIANGVLDTSGDNGFNTANPLATYSNSDPACFNQDCTDSGPFDHGAYFRFNFGTLLAGASHSFEIFYGAAGTAALALAAIGREGIELYSLGQSNVGQFTGEPATYIFGFKGLGLPPVDVDVPEPFSLAMMGIGIAGFAAARRRRLIA